MESLIFDRNMASFFFFYQTNIFIISSPCSWCKPCVTVYYRVLLLSRPVLQLRQPHTSVHPVASLWDQELRFLLVSKDKSIHSSSFVSDSICSPHQSYTLSFIFMGLQRLPAHLTVFQTSAPLSLIQQGRCLSICILQLTLGWWRCYWKRCCKTQSCE